MSFAAARIIAEVSGDMSDAVYGKLYRWISGNAVRMNVVRVSHTLKYICVEEDNSSRYSNVFPKADPFIEAGAGDWIVSIERVHMYSVKSDYYIMGWTYTPSGGLRSNVSQVTYSEGHEDFEKTFEEVMSGE